MRLDPATPYLKKGIYRHSKTGHLYEVLGVALHTETGEYLVVYRAVEPDETKQYHYELFVRPYAMFTETVDLNGIESQRFEPFDVK
jgi:hypothetical protein